MEYKHTVTEENAEKFAEWIQTRGGIAVWNSKDLSDPGYSVSSPVNRETGEPVVQPHWKVGMQPDLIITDPDEIEVVRFEEARRFRVALRRGSQGLKIKLTDAASEKVNKALEKAGEGSSYVFDYMTQEAVILKPANNCSLSDWMEANHEDN
jgi:hypothetical protein